MSKCKQLRSGQSACDQSNHLSVCSAQKKRKVAPIVGHFYSRWLKKRIQTWKKSPECWDFSKVPTFTCCRRTIGCLVRVKSDKFGRLSCFRRSKMAKKLTLVSIVHRSQIDYPSININEIPILFRLSLLEKSLIELTVSFHNWATSKLDHKYPP